MSDRMGKLGRAIRLVHLLADSVEGLTLDEMAGELGVGRRTAERLRDVIMMHFDLEEIADDRKKRFRIRDSLKRAYTRPTAAEIAALQTEVAAQRKTGTPQAELLEKLLGKVKSALDLGEKKKLAPDLEHLVRLQRGRSFPGPVLKAEPEALAAIQGAIMAAACVEFDYRADGAEEPAWRRVIPYGLIHGPVTYLIGKMPDGKKPLTTFRLDRMSDACISDTMGAAPEDWDIDAWMAGSFGIWREDEHDIVLRVLPEGVNQARVWRFHPAQTIEEDGDGLIVRFRAGGLREIADHIYTWGGRIVIEGPEELREALVMKLDAARRSLGYAYDLA